RDRGWVFTQEGGRRLPCQLRGAVEINSALPGPADLDAARQKSLCPDRVCGRLAWLNGPAEQSYPDALDQLVHRVIAELHVHSPAVGTRAPGISSGAADNS